MAEQPKISVIVPVYNMERYLSICLESIVNQSYKNLELIIVDDASTDQSQKIIDEYVARDHRIIPVRLDKNIGVGNARNTGLKLATGEYASFIDSDDWIDSDFYRKLVGRIQLDGGEIALCGIKTEYGNSKSSSLRYEYPYETCITNTYALRLLANAQNTDQFISPMIGNKIYNTSFLHKNKLYFDPSRSFQDDYFTFFCFIYAKKVSMVSDTYFHYYQRSDSITHVFSKKLVLDCLDILLEIKKRLLDEDIMEIYQQEYYSFFERCLSSLLNMLHSREHDSLAQKNYLVFVFDECFKRFTAKEIVAYIDNQRIFDFFHV